MTRFAIKHLQPSALSRQLNQQFSEKAAMVKPKF